MPTSPWLAKQRGLESIVLRDILSFFLSWSSWLVWKGHIIRFRTLGLVNGVIDLITCW